MLDDIRQQTNAQLEEEDLPPQKQAPRMKILGMTPPQTLIIATLMLFFACLLSAAVLIVTGRIVPPFLY